MSDKKFTATLIRGNCFFLGNTRFDANKAVPVTVAQRDHLEEHAVDKFNTGGEEFTKPKFEFEEITEDGDSGESSANTSSKPTRKRNSTK